MPADLHVHSNLSDGTHTPSEVVDLAKEAGLKTIALTDHDIVEGVPAAQQRGVEVGVEVIPGIEFTTEVPQAEVHLLGYFIDCKSPELFEVLRKIQEDRVRRIFKIVEKLKGVGVDLDPEEVFALSGKKSPGRPHVARALIEHGFVRNFSEAFARYLDFNAPAYVSHYKLTPAEAIQLIRQIGGIAVFAHPAISNCDEIIPDLMKEGLRGLEVYYTGHTVVQTRHYLGLAKKYGLLITGGSDFHGFDSGREVKLGGLTIPDELVDRLKDEHLRGNKS